MRRGVRLFPGLAMEKEKEKTKKNKKQNVASGEKLKIKGVDEKICLVVLQKTFVGKLQIYLC